MSTRPTKSSDPSPNELLTPTYWGSLGALILGIAYTVIATIRSGVPEHVMPWDKDGGATPVFYGALVYVSLFTCRYYCAVCVNVYGSSTGAFFHWPRGAPRRLAFTSLSALVLLAISSVAAVIALGVPIAILMCVLMAGISFLVFGAAWLLGHVDRGKYGRIQTSFGLGDLVLVAMSLLALEAVAGNVTDVSVVALFILAALLGIFVVVEFRRRYFRAFLVQFRALVARLDR